MPKPPKSAPAVRSNGRGAPAASATPMAAAADARAAHAMARFRDTRSESQPSGHCNASVPPRTAAMKADIPPTSSPILWAKFGPMPQKPPIARPVKKTPTAARGDTRTTSLSATGSCSTSAGGWLGSNVIGTTAADINSDTTRNKVTLAGAAMLRSVTLPLFRVALNPRFTRPFYAVPRTSAARTASG